MNDSLSLVIQAGGESRRMGEDKALKPFLGQPLILRVINRLRHLPGEMLITSSQPGKYAFLELKVFPDQYPGRGALGGLHTALFHASLPLVAVVACDMPFASAGMLGRMVEVMQKEMVDVVVPCSETGWEPMHAVYRQAACLPAITAALEAGEQKAIAWFPAVRVRAFTMEEAAACDPSGLAFWNLNTREEFSEAEGVAGENPVF